MEKEKLLDDNGKEEDKGIWDTISRLVTILLGLIWGGIMAISQFKNEQKLPKN